MYCKLTCSIIPSSAACFLTSRCLRVDPTVAFVWHIYLYFILFHICSYAPTVRVRQIYKSSVNDVSTWWLLARETSGHINNNFRYLWRETSQIQCGTGTVITNAPPPTTPNTRQSRPGPSHRHPHPKLMAIDYVLKYKFSDGAAYRVRALRVRHLH